MIHHLIPYFWLTIIFCICFFLILIKTDGRTIWVWIISYVVASITTMAHDGMGFSDLTLLLTPLLGRSMAAAIILLKNIVFPRLSRKIKREKKRNTPEAIQARHLVQKKYDALQQQPINPYYLQTLIKLSETALIYKLNNTFQLYSETFAALTQMLEDGIDYNDNLSPKKIYCTNEKYIKNIYEAMGQTAALSMHEFLDRLDPYLNQIPSRVITQENREVSLILEDRLAETFDLGKLYETMKKYPEDCANTTEYKKFHQFYQEYAKVMTLYKCYTDQVIEQVNDYKKHVFPIIKGDIGERSIERYLKEHTSQWEIINNANLPMINRSRGSFENDMLIVCTNGIFTLEIKNWSQNLSISKDGTVRRDNEIVHSDKENPVHQSTMHAAELSKFLYAAVKNNDDLSSLDFNNIVHSMIVMTDDKAKIRNNSSYVVIRKELIRQEITNHSVCLTQQQVEETAAIIRKNLRAPKKFEEYDVYCVINSQIQYAKEHDILGMYHCVEHMHGGLLNDSSRFDILHDDYHFAG